MIKLVRVREVQVVSHYDTSGITVLPVRGFGDCGLYLGYLNLGGGKRMVGKDMEEEEKRRL